MPPRKPRIEKVEAGGMAGGVPQQAPSVTSTAGGRLAEELVELAMILRQIRDEAVKDKNVYGNIGPYVAGRLIDDLDYVATRLEELAKQLRAWRC